MAKKIFLLLFSIILISCEKVIDVDLPDEEPRLVVDALIRLDLNEPTVNVQVKVSESSSFFESNTPVTTIPEITIVNLGQDPFECGNCLTLTQVTPGTGIYEAVTSPDFFLDGDLIIQLSYQGRSYVGETRFVPTVPLDSVVQGTGILFDDEETEVIVTFTDEADREDYYLFDFDFAEFLVTRDEFYQGQEFSFSYFYDQNFEPGTEIEISLMGVDRSFFNYMDLLIQQSDAGFDLFASPVATVRGNIFDVTDIDNDGNTDNVDQSLNFPLGYFAVVEVSKQTLIIE